MSYDNIPQELQRLIQWCVWRYETPEGATKPTKVPYNPKTGRHASSADRQTWCLFSEAVEAAKDWSKWAGIGFFFSDNDPYCGVDLDATDDPAIVARQQQIYEILNSYSEYSPSGKGLHIIVKASVQGGRKRDSVEIYSSGRYFTFTGNVYHNAPIAERQELITNIFEVIQDPSKPKIEYVGSNFQEREDKDIYDAAYKAKNGEKFLDLWNGNWQKYYKSQSEADFSLINIIAYYTKHKPQIIRLFRMSSLGQRDKANRDDYLNPMISRAFDNELPADRFSGFLADAPPLPSINQAYSSGNSEIFPIIEATSLAGRPIPPRAWHVAGMMPSRNITLLGGDGGTGKSIIALHLAASTVLGRPWLGMNVQQGGCLFVTAEDDENEVHRRLADIAASENVGLDALVGLSISSLAERDAILAVPEGRTKIMTPTRLYDVLAARIATTRPALVVLDTLADMFGGEENDRAQARQFIGLLRRLAVRYGCTVLLLAHPSLSGMASGSGTSGSTAWNNSVRSRLYFERITDDRGVEPDGDIRRLKTMKANYGQIGQEIHVRWQNGVFIAIASFDSGPHAIAKAEADADTKFMELLATYTAQGRTVSDARSSPDHAPKLFAKDPAGNPITKQGYEAAMNRLFTAGRIRVGKSNGSPSRQKNIIVAAEGVGESFHPPFQPTANLFPPPCDPPC